MERAIIIALDPASNTGYCVVSVNENGNVTVMHSGSVSFKPKKSVILSINDAPNSRYGRLYQWLEEEISNAKEKARHVVVAVEESGNFVRGKKAIEVANRIFGVISSCTYNNKVVQVDVSVGDIKKFITGRGNAPKEDVIAAVKNKYNFFTTDDNEADAYALSRLIVENINAYIYEHEKH